MIRDGALENPRPDVFLAAHLWNDRPVGSVDVTPGPVMAAEKWTCVIRGQGGHGALPHQTVDPIVTAVYAIVALQTIVSRNIRPLETAVVTVGAIHGGDAFNVIPAQVELAGTSGLTSRVPGTPPSAGCGPFWKGLRRSLAPAPNWTLSP
ncbi:MAG: hypothetical protein D6793_12350 [Thermoflexia bacterium]|nr:MAG: hypothetical protein D6793_12350 [Thermoflexia bacterium]